MTDEERLELGDQLGRIVMYFVEQCREARKERDDALRRAEEAERRLTRLTTKPDGDVLATAVSL